MATKADVDALRYFTWGEFKRPGLLYVPFLHWLDQVRHVAGVPFVVTSDGRDFIPPGGSSTSLHLIGRAVDLRFPWTAAGPPRQDGRALAAITRAVFAVRPPDGEGGVEYGIEATAIGGPHLHIGLFPAGRGDWVFTR